MTNRVYRVGIVGASSLAGKEVSDELGESLLGASNFVLLDDEDVAGQITSAGDEPAFIQAIERASFDRMDFVFFAGGAEVTKKHWQDARRAGASIVDLTYALEREKDVWCERRGSLKHLQRKLRMECRSLILRLPP